MREDYYWYWVNNIVGMSNAKLKKLFAVFDTPEEIYKASDRLLESVKDIRQTDIATIKESRKDDYIYRQSPFPASVISPGLGYIPPPKNALLVTL